MKVLARHAAGKALQNDNLEIANRAQEAKKIDPAVINATSGMFFHEGNVFRGFRTVEKILNELPDEDFYAYSPSDGGARFREAVLNWVFGFYREEIEHGNAVRVVATPGGTGAIHASVFLGLDRGEKLIFPDLCWAPYYGMAANLGLNTATFGFFSGEGFNFKGLQATAEKVASEQGKLALIINDPCNNPTGYTLSEAELREIVTFLNTLIQPVLLIYDIAYLDFADNNARRCFKILSGLNENILTAVAFSASKTFSVYGQRLGALIIMGRSEKAVSEFYDAAKFTARHTWSNANRGLINLLITLDEDSFLKRDFLSELNGVKEIIGKRAKIFMEEAEKAKLLVHPYRSGFFVTLPVRDVHGALKALAEEEKIYLLPVSGSVRLALSAISEAETRGLAARLKKALTPFQ